MKIIIKGLNHERDYKIDLDKKCTIFVGNNGCGKTTTMNLLLAVMHNHLDIFKYIFEEIQVYCDSEKSPHIIKYDDLLPTENNFIKLFKEGKLTYLDCGHNKPIKKSVFVNEKDFDKFIYNLNEYRKHNNHYYYELLSFTLNYAAHKTDNVFDDFYKLYYKKVAYHLKYSLLETISEKSDIDCFLKRLLFSSYSFINNYDKVLFDPSFNLYPLLISQFKSNIVNTDADNYAIIDRYTYEEFNISKKDISFKIQLEEYKKNLLKEKVEFYNIGNYVSVQEYEIDIFVISNSLIEDEAFIKKFIIDYERFINEYEYQEEVKHSYDSSIMSIYEFYIKPFVPRGSLLDYSDYNDFFDMHKYDMIYELVKKFERPILWHINKSLKSINKTLKKYFKDKKIYITPRGVVISKSNAFSDDLRFEQLSIGEQKIIALVLTCYYFEDRLLLIDEPESSLSIVWQKRLLGDLLKNKNNNRFIIATQSPYIVDNFDELYKYIVWINEDDKNE